MSNNPNNPNKLAFSSQCVPGSAAELQETERMAEFQRSKALRVAQELRDKPGEVAQRHEAYLAGCEENKERIRKKRAGYSTFTPRTGQ